jgi:hypothetical protein
MMEAAQNCNAGNAVIFRNAMSSPLKLGLRNRLVWNSRSEARMRTTAIVMAYPRFECLLDVRLVKWDHKVLEIVEASNRQLDVESR